MAEDLVPRTCEDTLICTLCKKRYASPRMLPCMHGFCTKCLQDHIANCPNVRLFCPSCFRDFDLPSSKAQDFPRNLLLENQVMKMNLLESDLSSGSTTKCGFCNVMLGCWFCFDCSKFLCQRCKEDHDNNSDIDDHTVTANENLSSKMPEIIANKAPFCDFHKRKRLRFFCCTCDQLVCWECTMDPATHKRHDYVKAKRQQKPSQESLLTLLEGCTSQIVYVKELAQKAEKHKAEVEAMVSVAKEGINQHFEEVMKKLNKDKDDMMEFICTLEQHQTEPLIQNAKKAKCLIDAMKNIQSVTGTVLGSNNPWELLSMKKHLETGFASLEEEKAILSSSLRSARKDQLRSVRFLSRPLDQTHIEHGHIEADISDTHGPTRCCQKLTPIEGNMLGSIVREKREVPASGFSKIFVRHKQSNNAETESD